MLKKDLYDFKANHLTLPPTPPIQSLIGFCYAIIAQTNFNHKAFLHNIPPTSLYNMIPVRNSSVCYLSMLSFGAFKILDDLCSQCWLLRDKVPIYWTLNLYVQKRRSRWNRWVLKLGASSHGLLAVFHLVQSVFRKQKQMFFWPVFISDLTSHGIK